RGELAWGGAAGDRLEPRRLRDVAAQRNGSVRLAGGNAGAPEDLHARARHQRAVLVAHAPAEVDEPAALVDCAQRGDLALDADDLVEAHGSLEHHIADAPQGEHTLG